MREAKKNHQARESNMKLGRLWFQDISDIFEQELGFLIESIVISPFIQPYYTLG